MGALFGNICLDFSGLLADSVNAEGARHKISNLRSKQIVQW